MFQCLKEMIHLKTQVSIESVPQLSLEIDFYLFVGDEKLSLILQNNHPHPLSVFYPLLLADSYQFGHFHCLYA